jgi:hypothetical protein
MENSMSKLMSKKNLEETLLYSKHKQLSDKNID